MAEPVILWKDRAAWFRCPGCGDLHMVDARWQFNGSDIAPTFSPSVRVACGHYASHYQPGQSCWCTHRADCVAAGEEPPSHFCYVCHFWITDGSIRFEADSTHIYQGLTVSMPPVSQQRLAL